MKKIQLISAPVDKGKIPLYEDGVFAPLGLIWLGTYLKHNNEDVEIIDGQHVNLDKIIFKLDADIVGLSFNIFSTESLDRIAEAAKNKGSTVVVGGQAATPLSKELLTNHNIDYVIRHDGRSALYNISRGILDTHNVSYRKDNKIIENEVLLSYLPGFPPVDWHLDGIITADYWDKFQEIIKSVPNNHKHRRPLSSFTKRGCPMRQNDKGCSFCSRVDTNLGSRAPKQAYDEFQYLVGLGADRIEEFSDSWLYDKKWLREFTDLTKKKGHWGIPVRVYADTRHIDPKTIEYMKVIGIDSVILGIESGNEEILQGNGKPNTIKQILNCADLLGKAGIKASPSYVLGLIGETEATVEDTFKIAGEIGRRCEIEMSYYSIMTPFPGSKAWGLLMEDSTMRMKHSGYKLDSEDLQRDFIERFTKLGQDGLDYLNHRLARRFKINTIAQRDY